MKLIHCADLHLGSPISSRLPHDKALTRKAELRAAFMNMVEYACSQDISLILLSGDVFDSDRPGKKDKDFFYSIVRNHPDIDFVYLRGNHDLQGGYRQALPNLKTFCETWSCYRYRDVAVWGLELCPANANTLYATFPGDAQQKNVVMLHGQLADTPGEGRICLPRLREQGIDYLALGHVHSFACGRLDSRGSWCYSGCLEGRGYDEWGPKGFVVLDTQDCSQPLFVSQPQRTVRRVEADISGCDDLYQACSLVRRLVPHTPRDLLRLELVGELDWDSMDLARELEDQLGGSYFHVSVKNRTTRRFDPALYAGEISLAGEFIRQVQALEDLSPVLRQQVIDTGLRALSGQEVGI